MRECTQQVRCEPSESTQNVKNRPLRPSRRTGTSLWVDSYCRNLGRRSVIIPWVYREVMKAKGMIDLAGKARFEPFQPAKNSRFRRFRPAPAIMGSFASQLAEEISTQALETLFESYLMHRKHPALHFVLMF